jgi:2-oxoglutarate ferredoxin oxidoreductase subunit beta
MKSLKSLNHDPTNRLAAMDLAQHYGHELHTGIFYQNPSPPPTLDSLMRERKAALNGQGIPRQKIFDLLLQKQ